MKLIGNVCLEPLLNSELLLSSSKTSVATAESSERDAELRGGEEHLKINQTEFTAADFMASDYTQKTILLNVSPSPYSAETLIGSSATTGNTLKLNLSAIYPRLCIT